jgi:hypothetical protein
VFRRSWLVSRSSLVRVRICEAKRSRSIDLVSIPERLRRPSAALPKHTEPKYGGGLRHAKGLSRARGAGELPFRGGREGRGVGAQAPARDGVSVGRRQR